MTLRGRRLPLRRGFGSVGAENARRAPAPLLLAAKARLATTDRDEPWWAPVLLVAAFVFYLLAISGCSTAPTPQDHTDRVFEFVASTPDGRHTFCKIIDSFVFCYAQEPTQ